MEGEKREISNFLNVSQVKNLAKRYGVGENFIDVGTFQNWQGIAHQVNQFLDFLPEKGDEKGKFLPPLVLGAVFASKVKNPEGEINFDFNKFRDEGGDPAKVLRAVLAYLSFPAGRTIQDERFSLFIGPDNLIRAAEVFRKLFPPFGKLETSDLIKILEGWGFTVNPNLGRKEGILGCSLAEVGRDKIEEILKEIEAVHSYY